VELAPCSKHFLNAYAGCQGFIGPLPSAFLDKCCNKELLQIYSSGFDISKHFLKNYDERLFAFIVKPATGKGSVL
jgi:hypothetical protein